MTVKTRGFMLNVCELFLCISVCPSNTIFMTNIYTFKQNLVFMLQTTSYWRHEKEARFHFWTSEFHLLKSSIKFILFCGDSAALNSPSWSAVKVCESSNVLKKYFPTSPWSSFLCLNFSKQFSLPQIMVYTQTKIMHCHGMMLKTYW